MMEGFELPVTEVKESFYLINKCTKKVPLQHIYQEQSVHVTNDTCVHHKMVSYRKVMFGSECNRNSVDLQFAVPISTNNPAKLFSFRNWQNAH